MKEVNWELLSKYLAEEATLQEKEQVDSWLQASEANRKYFEEVKRLWESAGEEKTLKEPDLQLAWRIVDRATSNNLRIPIYRHYWKIAACFILISLLGILLYFSTYSKRQVIVTTQLNEKEEIQLADGSRIWLNENSMLQYPEKFNGNLREVILQGEAFFEIARDETRPFQVQTGNSVTKVLGTSFNIRENEEQSIEIQVVSGKVSFYKKEAATKNILLQAGESGMLAAPSFQPVKSVNKDVNFLSWHTETLTFKNTALREVLPQLERFYNISILLENKNLNTCLLTSTFQKRTLQEVLQTLQTIYGLSYQIKGDTIYLSQGGC